MATRHHSAPSDGELRLVRQKKVNSKGMIKSAKSMPQLITPREITAELITPGEPTTLLTPRAIEGTPIQSEQSPTYDLHKTARKQKNAHRNAVKKCIPYIQAARRQGLLARKEPSLIRIIQLLVNRLRSIKDTL
jgi:hypothetical protein